MIGDTDRLNVLSSLVVWKELVLMKTWLEHSSGSKTSDRVVVIGGGLSGLAVAHRIQESAKTLRRPAEVIDP